MKDTNNDKIKQDGVVGGINNDTEKIDGFDLMMEKAIGNGSAGGMCTVAGRCNETGAGSGMGNASIIEIDTAQLKNAGEIQLQPMP